MSFDRVQIKSAFDDLAKKAKSEGAQVELLVDSGESLGLSVQKEKLEKFDQKTFQMAGFRVLYKGHQGYASTEKLSREAFEITFLAALQNAKDLSGEKVKDEVTLWSLPDNSASYKVVQELDFGEQGSLQDKIKMAFNLEKLTLATDSRIGLVPYSLISEWVSKRWILNSEGLDRSYQQRQFSSYSYPLAKQGEQSKMLGHAVVSRRLKDLKVDEIASLAAKKATEMLGAVKLETGKYPVVLESEVAQQFFSHLNSAVSAKRVFEKKSPFAGRIGEKVAADFVTIYDDPLDLRGGGARPFDAEGSPSQKTTIVERGVLKNFLTNREYASKMNLPLTSHAARSASSEMSIGGTTLVLPTGKETLSELLAKYPKVILIVELSAFHSGFNSVTGDFSLPGQGYLFEHGKKVKPVDQFVMSGNFFEVLKNIEGFSNQLGPLGSSVICPDVLLKELSFA